MEATHGERVVRVLRWLQGDERVNLVTLAGRMGIPYARLYSWVCDRAPFPAKRTQDLFRALASIDRVLAKTAFERLTGVREIGFKLVPLPAGTDNDDPVTDALQAQHALGDLAQALARAGAEIDSYEAAVALPKARALAAEAEEIVTKLEVTAAVTPQMAIGGTR